MSELMREAVAKAIEQAYADNQPQWAAYLELCLKTNEAPR